MTRSATETVPLRSTGHPAGYAALLLHSTISSFTFIVAKYALSVMPVVFLALARFSAASLVLAGIWLARGGRPGEFSRRDWGRLALLGLLAVPLNQGLFLFGLQRSSPAHAALFYATTPLFVTLLAALRREDRFTWGRVAGVGVALAGVVLVLLDRGLALDRRFLAGDVLLLLAVVCWALYSVEGRALMGGHSATTVTAVSLGLGTLMALPAAPWALSGLGPGPLPAAAWGAVAFLALVTSVLGYLLWVWCLSHTEASRVAVFSNLQPVLTTLLAWWLFRESFAPHFFLGGVLVLGGVVLVQRT
ncbi:MAG TPA: DMT family transporter [Candidatus Saccharimonadales bacterium]|nr:DMT family transporter [Candidatus Saccharimonadales bacterium]